MRILLPVPLVLLATACWTPGPGQLDPTRYPWDVGAQPVRGTGEHRHSAPESTYCIVSLETPNATGITAGGGPTMQMACKPPARPRSERSPSGAKG